MLAAAGAVLWGTLGPAVHVWSSTDPAETSLLRSLIAATVLAGLAWSPVRQWSSAVRNWRALAAGGLGLAGFQYCYLAALPAAGVSVSTAIAIGLAPLFTGLITWVLDSRPSTSWFLGTAGAVVGLVLMLSGAENPSARWATGVGWSVLAAAMFSVQIVAIQRTSTTRWPVAAALAWMFAAATIILALLGMTRMGSYSPVDGGDLLLALYLGGVTAGLAYWLFALGARVVGAATAATISLLEPAAALLLAVAFLHESVAAVQLVGMALLVSSVVATAWLPGSGHPTPMPQTRRSTTAHSPFPRRHPGTHGPPESGDHPRPATSRSSPERRAGLGRDRS